MANLRAENSKILRTNPQTKQANSFGFPSPSSQSTRVTRMPAPNKPNGKKGGR